MDAICTLSTPVIQIVTLIIIIICLAGTMGNGATGAIAIVN